MEANCLQTDRQTDRQTLASYRGARAPKNYETYNRSVKKYFDLINNLKSDEMNALKPNDSLTFTFL